MTMTINNFSTEELVKKFPAVAEYLIQIFIVKRDYGIVKNSEIAKRLGISKPAVTQAMNRLKKYDLIEQDLYGKINLTQLGYLNASQFLRRHYLIEHLLIKTLDYNWIKSDEEASRLQSSLSETFTEFLFEKFGRPETCPHGNPFPGAKSESEIIKAPRLSSGKAGEFVEIVRITEEGEAADGLLQFCYDKKIKPSKKVDIKDIDDNGVYIKYKRSRAFLVPFKFADYICYKNLS